MNSIIKHLAIATKLLNQPVAEEALAANVARDRNLNANIQSLSEVLRSYGFENHISRRKLVEIPSLAMPVIIILHNDEAAVVSEVKGRGEERVYVVRQGDAPAHEISHKDLEAQYLGFCWFIKPKLTADHRSELPEYHLPKAWFWKVIGRFKKYYYQVILASFLINILALVSSLYVMNVYDRVIPNQAYSTLWVLSIGVFLAITFEFIAKMIRSHLTDIAGKKADLIVSSALFRRVMALRLIERPISSGSYANNLRDFEAVREFMTSASLLVLVDAPFLLLFLFVMFVIDGKLVIVPAVTCALVLLISFAVQPTLAKRINESMKESSQRQGLAVEAVEGIETLKVNNATNWAQQRWDRLNALTAISSMKVKQINEFVSNFTVGLQQLNTAGLVVLGTYLIHDDVVEARITMGAVIASVILSGRALSSLGKIAGLAIRYQQAKNALKGVNSIVERPIERDPERSYVTLDQVQGQITFNNVVFKYNKDSQPAIANLNLTIRPGEKVAILGRIGSGKSTLLKLASGLYEPTGGNILLDNVDIRQIDPNFLRDKVTLLNQSPRLFLGTLRENLDLARMDGYSTDQELLGALRNFHLDQLVRNHPKGLDMPLGEDGLGLSGGQKQIVSLARLTLRHPRVVLLDEPTTGLDEQTEQQALGVLAQWARDKTVVVVTHRLQVLLPLRKKKKKVSNMSNQQRENINQEDLKLINDLNAALQSEKHTGYFSIISLFLSFIIAFIIWAYFSPLEEVTQGQGRIIPSSREQIVQSLDPGTIQEMLVKEGDTVEKGQILLRLDDTRSSAILRESQAKVENLEAMVARLQAEAYNTNLVFPDHISDELKKREEAAYVSRRRAMEEQVSGLRQSKDALEQQIAIAEPMVKRGVMSQVDLLRMQRDSHDLEAQITERQNRYTTDASNELVKTESELAQAKENMAMRADPVERSQIRAPMKGIVKNIRINTIGGVVNAGQDILEIVPIEDNLLVEAYIRPNDVAFIRPGLPAVVKLTAYDYAIYGGLQGEVTLISPDTLSDEKHNASELKLNMNNVYYRILVKTSGSHLVDKTGEKTVFQYLIKPITRMKQALRER